MKNKKSPLLFIATFALGAPAVYAADLAWERTLGFFMRHLD